MTHVFNSVIPGYIYNMTIADKDGNNPETRCITVISAQSEINGIGFKYVEADPSKRVPNYGLEEGIVHYAENIQLQPNPELYGGSADGGYIIGFELINTNNFALPRTNQTYYLNLVTDDSDESLEVVVTDVKSVTRDELNEHDVIKFTYATEDGEVHEAVMYADITTGTRTAGMSEQAHITYFTSVKSDNKPEMPFPIPGVTSRVTVMADAKNIPDALNFKNIKFKDNLAFLSFELSEDPSETYPEGFYPECEYDGKSLRADGDFGSDDELFGSIGSFVEYEIIVNDQETSLWFKIPVENHEHICMKAVDVEPEKGRVKACIDMRRAYEREYTEMKTKYGQMFN